MAVNNALDMTVAWGVNGYTTKVRNVTFTASAAALDTTGAGETGDYDTYIGGRRSIAGTYTCKWDNTDDIFGSANSYADPSNYRLGGTALDTLTITFKSGNTLAVSAIVTAIEGSSDIDNANDVTFTWQGSGVPTYVVGS